jgi:hypothetical protein
MTSLDQVLAREVAKWRSEPYSRFKELTGGFHIYSIQEDGTQYAIEINTKKNDRSPEIIVMFEVSRPALFGASIGKAQYFAVSPNGGVRDATPDEAF